MRAFRNSQLRLGRQCGFAYLKQYVECVPQAPSGALEGGRNVHAAAQLLVRRVVEGGPIDVYDIAYRTARGGTAEYADALRVLIRMQEAIGVEFTIDPRAVFLLEERLTMQLTLRDGRVVEFYGTPDLASRTGKGACRVDDWKSQWVPDTEQEFQADAQLPRYALLIHEHYPAMERFDLVKRFVRWQNSSLSMTLTVDDLHQVREALISEIEARIELDDAGAFEPTPGEWCALCGVHALCPRIREYLDAERDIDVPAVADDDHCRSLAADAHVLEQAADKIKAQLKRYLGAEHPKGYVPLPGGGYYGFLPQNHRHIDHAELTTALEAAGVEPPANLANTNLKVFDRLLKVLPENAVKRAEDVVRHSQSPQFRYRKNIPEATAAPVQSEPEELFT